MGKFCTRCGNSIEEGQVCPNCFPHGAPENNVNFIPIDTSSLKSFFLSMKNRMGLGDPSNDANGLYERDIQVTPGSIEPTSGEIPIKQFNIAVLRTRLKLMRSEGRMQITNKRLLFRATGRSIRGKTVLQHEFAIDEIAGLEIKNQFRLSFFNLLFISFLVQSAGIGLGVGIAILFAKAAVQLGIAVGILLGIAGVIPFFYFYKRFWLKVAAISIGFGGLSTAYTLAGAHWTVTVLMFIVSLIMFAAVIIASFIPDLTIIIKNKGGQMGSGPIVIKRVGLFQLLQSTVYGNDSGFTDVMPTVETDGAIREIGAIINDIQKLGDFGIEKWKS